MVVARGSLTGTNFQLGRIPSKKTLVLPSFPSPGSDLKTVRCRGRKGWEGEPPESCMEGVAGQSSTFKKQFSGQVSFNAGISACQTPAAALEILQELSGRGSKLETDRPANLQKPIKVCLNI